MYLPSMRSNHSIKAFKCSSSPVRVRRSGVCCHYLHQRLAGCASSCAGVQAAPGQDVAGERDSDWLAGSLLLNSYWITWHVSLCMSMHTVDHRLVNNMFAAGSATYTLQGSRFDLLLPHHWTGKARPCLAGFLWQQGCCCKATAATSQSSCQNTFQPQAVINT